MEEIDEISEGKTPAQMRVLARQLKNKANEKEREEENAKARKIAEGITLNTPVFFYVGNGKDKKVIGGKVIQITQNGISAETEDGKKFNRRFKKVYTEDQAKEAGIV